MQHPGEDVLAADRRPHRVGEAGAGAHGVQEDVLFGRDGRGAETKSWDVAREEDALDLPRCGGAHGGVQWWVSGEP